MAAIQWKVEGMKALAQHAGQSLVVVEVAWRCNAIEQRDKRRYDATTYGTVLVQLSDELADFTPFQALTEEQVLGWAFDAGVDRETIEQRLVEQIAEQINPPIVIPPLPWSVPA